MLENLLLARYRFALECLSPIEFRSFAGSTLRGAFGSVFRRLVCITRSPTCEGCLLRQQCAYGYVFETAPPPDSERLRRYESVPRPYVLDAPEGSRLAFAEGERLHFGLTLVGRASDYFPYFVFAFQRLEESGLGAGRQEGKGRFRLLEVLAERADGGTVPVYTPDSGLDTLRLPVIRGTDLIQKAQRLPTDRLGVRFVTPTRLRFEGKLTDEVEFHHLIRALLHRLSSLLYFHCGTEPAMDFTRLIEQAQGVRTVRRSLQWVEQERYSRRQRSRLQMGGFTGEAVFEGDIEPFLPLLVAGEYVHIGKGTVMGLGKIQLVCEEGKEDA
ncbi:hypothetical protein HRbin16_01098 [bacterium HR16]|nr:hypothetical protein HRbin16_01098 [bacterium HR16]